jgi:hypothetical protein
VNDDWCIRLDLRGDPASAREIAEELARYPLDVSRNGTRIFVYAASREGAERARAVIESELRTRRAHAAVGVVAHWLTGESRWDQELSYPRAWPERARELCSRLLGCVIVLVAFGAGVADRLARDHLGVQPASASVGEPVGARGERAWHA